VQVWIPFHPPARGSERTQSLGPTYN